MSDDLSSSEEVVWRALVKKDRPLWKRLFAQTLAQAQVRSPDGTPYVVRVSRNSPFKPGNVGDVNSAIELAVENVRRAGNTGWSITVLEPPGGLAGARELYRQEVQAQAIVVDGRVRHRGGAETRRQTLGGGLRPHSHVADRAHPSAEIRVHGTVSL